MFTVFQATKAFHTGEELLWPEQASPENPDLIVWLCAASSAERFWMLPNGRPHNVASTLPCLHDMRFNFWIAPRHPGYPFATALRSGTCALRGSTSSSEPQLQGPNIQMAEGLSLSRLWM
jgi:hypothetical protein